MVFYKLYKAVANFVGMWESHRPFQVIVGTMVKL